MNILLLDGYFGGSHVQWAKSISAFSQHDIEIYSLSANHWKWRMQGAAIHFIKKLKEEKPKVDLFLATDMLNLPLFKSLLPKEYIDIPIILYMHENQITYPWSPDDPELKLKRDASFSFINYSSALVADRILFNSKFHLNSFLDGVEKLLKKLPDYKHYETIIEIQNKSEVKYVGVNLEKIKSFEVRQENKVPTILWNHRWEYDKDPNHFFEALFQLKAEKIDFKLVVIGREYERQPTIFQEAKKELSNHILQFGYVETSAKYYDWLWKSDITPVTNKQDFFGISVVEAISCACYPLLPKDLCYQEHLALDEFGHHFYDRENLYDKLKNLILSKEYLNTKSCSLEMGKYDWNSLIKDYDLCFEKSISFVS